MQGHQEAPQLWEKHMDRILLSIGLRPMIHELYLYSGVVAGSRVLLLYQVVTFAVAAPSLSVASQIFILIDDKLTIPLKRLGLITLFNGIDVIQTQEYIKITCKLYLEWTCKKYYKEVLLPLKMKQDRNTFQKSHCDDYAHEEESVVYNVVHCSGDNARCKPGIIALLANAPDELAASSKWICKRWNKFIGVQNQLYWCSRCKAKKAVPYIHSIDDEENECRSEGDGMHAPIATGHHTSCRGKVVDVRYNYNNQIRQRWRWWRPGKQGWE